VIEEPKDTTRPDEDTSQHRLKWTLKEKDMRVRVRIAQLWAGTSGGLL
jgi:hypothetical protein